MDQPRPGTTRMTGNLGSAGRGPGVLALVIALFLGVALVKPWGSPGDAPPARPVTVERSAPPSGPAPTADPLAALRVHCQEPIGWRTYSRERWSGGIVRSWRSMAPISDAGGPLDRRIPVVPLGAAVEAMGYCSPWRAPERPPDDARTTVWQIETAPTGGSASASRIDLVRFVAFPASPLGALFTAPPRAPAGGAPAGGAPAGTSPASAVPAGGAPASGVLASGVPASATPGVGIWPPGRYVLAVRGTAFARWWAVQIDPPVTP